MINRKDMEYKKYLGYSKKEKMINIKDIEYKKYLEESKKSILDKVFDVMKERLSLIVDNLPYDPKYKRVYMYNYLNTKDQC